MKTEGVEGKVRSLAQPVVEGLEMELVDVAFVTEHGRRVLRVTIDKPGGVTVDDCAEISRELGTILDVEDPIPQRYSLEVSSPGLDRPLLNENDFKRFAGRKARIKTREPIEGRKNFKAVIDSVEGGRVRVTDFDGKVFDIPLDHIDRARLEVEF